MSTQTLSNIGLNDKEAALYMLLLEKGELPPQELVKLTKLKRPTVYANLNTLVKKGLVVLIDKGKKLHAYPQEPSKLLDVAKKTLEDAQTAHSSLVTLLPKLLSDYTLNVKKPIVSVYEGVEGLKTIYNEMLRVKEPIYAMLQYAEVDEELKKWLDTTFTRKRVELKIPVKTIVNGLKVENYIEQSKEVYRSVAHVTDPSFTIHHEVAIFGNNIAFIDHKKGENLIGVLISHPLMAATMRGWFELSWKGAVI
jgi:sugar-specific transcriptional regulator TrmB